MPCGPPQTSVPHGRPSPNLGFSPDPSGGAVTQSRGPHLPTQGPQPPAQSPGSGWSAPGLCVCGSEPQATAAPQEAVQSGLLLFVSEEQSPLEPAGFRSCLPFLSQTAPLLQLLVTTRAEPPPGSRFRPRRGVRRLDRRRHCLPRGGVTPHRVRAQTHTTAPPPSDALRLFHPAAEERGSERAVLEAPALRPGRPRALVLSWGRSAPTVPRARPCLSPGTPGPSARGVSTRMETRPSADPCPPHRQKHGRPALQFPGVPGRVPWSLVHPTQRSSSLNSPLTYQKTVLHVRQSGSGPDAPARRKGSWELCASVPRMRPSRGAPQALLCGGSRGLPVGGGSVRQRELLALRRSAGPPLTFVPPSRPSARGG
ncbi:unnamed protein product [Rangifer tarandus platyrhynchus]|uniref:Uncharacterized protein n=1 Tax=Rangifer tarandus platyrhynchus TaxID=3082113 RepID=A0AC59YHK1_RANTA